MSAFLRIVATFILATLVGAVVGWRWLSPSQQPPKLQPRPTEPEEPHVALNRASENAGKPGSKTKRPTKVTADDSALPHGGAAARDVKPDVNIDAAAVEVLVPSRTDRLRDDDSDLLPRGPEAWVDVDLTSAKLSVLAIRSGMLKRDGAATWKRFARSRKVGTLRGRNVRVALLHLGFDREGQPVIAHIRTSGQSPVEGIIPLRVNNLTVVVRRAHGSDDTIVDAP